MTPIRPKNGLREVAQLAGVSLATASRALSQPELVSETVRQRIEQVCREVDYVPNHSARRLSMNRSEMIGLIVPTTGNPLFAPAIDGVRMVLDEYGYGMAINSAERDAGRELDQVRHLVAHGVDAIITLMPLHLPELFRFIKKMKVPLICAESDCPEPGIPVVSYDNAGAMTEITQHILSLGHRQIAVFSGPRESTPVIGDRLDVILATLKTAGIEPPPERVVECDYDIPLMRQKAREMLVAADLPTAIICSGDQHAVSVLLEAQCLGITVPDTLSVTGCNDVAIAQLCNPQLSTQHLPYLELGQTAGRLAIDLLAGREPPLRTLLPHSLIIRGSAGPVKQGYPG